LCVLLSGMRFAHFGHPVCLWLFVRLHTIARHTCLHLTLLHFHFAL
jgi:hypothetical protein